MSAVVADLTGTAFCDCSGARSLLLAYHKAAASNTQLLLAVPSGAVLPILELLGLRRILRIYPTLAAALAAVAEAAAPATGGVPPPIQRQSWRHWVMSTRLGDGSAGAFSFTVTRSLQLTVQPFSVFYIFKLAGQIYHSN